MLIINTSLSKVVLFIIIVPLLPIIQGQWLNIALLNNDNISIYKFIYYFSGYLFPLILFSYSLNNLTDYQFKSNFGKDINKGFRKIFYIIFPILLILSTIIIKYFLYLFSTIRNEKFYLLEFDSLQFIFISIFIVLLLIRVTKKIVKNLYLIFYLATFSIYWTINSYPLNLYIPFLDVNYLNKFISNNIDFNYINILFLFILEILFFIWSYISNKNNLSDWYVPLPNISDFYILINIFLFYFGIVMYFYIFRNISLQS